MENARIFRERLAAGDYLLGATVTYNDPTVSEALCNVMDFLWIDMEHNPMSLADIQGHIMACKGTRCVPLVRVRRVDSDEIKSVLDIGAAGIIGPNVRNAAQAALLVKSCLYPPEGIRGFGPRRPGRYGARITSATEFARECNKTVIVAAQIESQEAVDDIDAILAVPGLTSICFGPNDMSGNMGLMGQPGHPSVVKNIETCIQKARAKGVFAGMGSGLNIEAAAQWIGKGAQWMQLADDFGFMLDSARRVYSGIRELTGKRD